MSDAVTKAMAELNAQAVAARQELADFATEHRFEMDGECVDKAGNPTRALIVKIDPPGFMGLYMSMGSPYSIDSKTGVTENRDVTNKWLQAMSNVDLADEAKLAAVGIYALDSARAVVQGFFMLKLVSNATAPSSQAKLSSSSPQVTPANASEPLQDTSATPATAGKDGAM